MNSSAGVGGGEKHLLLLARYLHGGELDLRFVVPEEGVFARQLRQAGLTCHVVPMTSKLDVRAWLRMYRVVRSVSPDVVHTQGARAGWYGRLPARVAGTPLIFSTVHNSLRNYEYSEWRRRLYVRLERATGRCVDQWVAVSRSIAGELSAYHGIDPARVAVIPNGVDLAELEVHRGRLEVRREAGIQAEALMVVQVSRMTEQKGHRFLLDAVARVSRDLPGLQCLLAGDGPTRPSLERQARRLGISGCVHFLGFRSDVADLFHAADIAVLPSLSEGMPLGVLESMAAGCATLAAAVNGTVEVIRDGVNGRLVPPGDAGALAEALRGLAADPALRARLAAAGRETVDRDFTAQAMAGRYRSLYLGHLSQRRAAESQ